jgi:hypothetical protein
MAVKTIWTKIIQKARSSEWKYAKEQDPCVVWKYPYEMLISYKRKKYYINIGETLATKEPSLMSPVMAQKHCVVYNKRQWEDKNDILSSKPQYHHQKTVRSPGQLCVVPATNSSPGINDGKLQIMK